METLDLIDELQQEINRLWKGTVNQLVNINERTNAQFRNHDLSKFTRHTCPDEYYRNIAIYAWGARGEQIGLIKLQDKLNELKAKVKGA